MNLLTLFAIYAFVWGAMWGSFLNVVIYRVPRGLSIVRPRSHCPSCNRPIRWWENVPLLSYVWLRGRCRGCGARISARYVLVELLTAVLSLLLFLKCAEGRLVSDSPASVLVPFLVYFYFICTAVAIAFIDLELTVVPDALTVPGIAVGLLGAIIFPRGRLWADFHPAPTWLDSLLGAVLGLGLIFGIIWAYRKVTGRVGMGSGDATVLGMIGAFLGAQALVLVLFFASAQGLLAALAAAGLERVHGRRGGFLLRGVHRPEYWDPAPPAAEPAHPDGTDAPATLPRAPDASPTEPSAEEADDDAPAERAASPGDGEDVTLAKTGLPFGPFLALAAVEYLFVGGLVERWLAGAV